MADWSQLPHLACPASHPPRIFRTAFRSSLLSLLTLSLLVLMGHSRHSRHYDSDTSTDSDDTTPTESSDSSEEEERPRRRRKRHHHGYDDDRRGLISVSGSHIPARLVLTFLADRNALLTTRTTTCSGLASASSSCLLLSALAATIGGHIVTALRRHSSAEPAPRLAQAGRAGRAGQVQARQTTAAALEQEQGPQAVQQVAMRRIQEEEPIRRQRPPPEPQARQAAAALRLAGLLRRQDPAARPHRRLRRIPRARRLAAAREAGKDRSWASGRIGRGCRSPTPSSRRISTAFGALRTSSSATAANSSMNRFVAVPGTAAEKGALTMGEGAVKAKDWAAAATKAGCKPILSIGGWSGE